MQIMLKDRGRYSVRGLQLAALMLCLHIQVCSPIKLHKIGIKKKKMHRSCIATSFRSCCTKTIRFTKNGRKLTGGNVIKIMEGST